MAEQSIHAIVEGGILRAIYIDGSEVDEETFDLDVLDGGTVEELRELRDRIEETMKSFPGSGLAHDLETWLDDIDKAIRY